MFKFDSDEHRKHLQRQCEKIADLATEKSVQVIVQMDASQELQGFVEASAEIMRRRLSVVSARELIPPHRSARVAMKRSGSGRSRSPKATASPTERYFRSEFEATSLGDPAAAQRASVAALKPFLSSQWTKRVLSRQRRAAKRARVSIPQTFWSARAAVLEVTKEELRDLPSERMIADIYPNRRLRVPPVTKASAERPALADYKGFTWGLSRTGALSCWGAFDARGQDVLVAVLDTGVDADHPDLRGKVKGFAEFDEEGSIVTDSVKKAYDSDQHGTHCAGVIVGGKASGRCIGMAPDAKILAGMVLKNGEGTDAQILGGIEWAMRKGAHVISMSLGGLRMSADVLDLYTRAIINANRLGIPVVVAVGNEGSQTTGSPGNDYFAFTVGATDVDDRAAGFSGGRTQIVEESRYMDPQYLPVVYSKPDVSAPGVDIFSSIPGKKKGQWEAWNGTSMATPHVAGAMALLLSAPSRLMSVPGSQRVDILQNLLISSVKELGESGQNHRFGYGRIDVARAMGYAQELGYFSD